MRVKRVGADSAKLCEATKQNCKTAGNTQVVKFTTGNNKPCSIHNLSKDTYFDTEMGEVKPKKKSVNRYKLGKI